MSPESMHVTLLFLGEVDDRELHPVCKAVKRPRRANLRFPSRVRLGRSPRAPAEVCGPESPTAPNRFSDLMRRWRMRMLDLGCYRKEERGYTPHLTLGRVKDADSLRDGRGIAQAAAWEGGRIAVDEVLVFSSETERDGPVYTVIGRAALRGSRVDRRATQRYSCGMKRIILIAALACVIGCSNAPVAGFLDNCFPSRAKSGGDAAPSPRPPADPIPLRPTPPRGPAPQLPPPDFGPTPPGDSRRTARCGRIPSFDWYSHTTSPVGSTSITRPLFSFFHVRGDERVAVGQPLTDVGFVMSCFHPSLPVFRSYSPTRFCSHTMILSSPVPASMPWYCWGRSGEADADLFPILFLAVLREPEAVGGAFGPPRNHCVMNTTSPLGNRCPPMDVVLLPGEQPRLLHFLVVLDHLVAEHDHHPALGDQVDAQRLADARRLHDAAGRVALGDAAAVLLRDQVVAVPSFFTSDGVAHWLTPVPPIVAFTFWSGPSVTIALRPYRCYRSR